MFDISSEEICGRANSDSSCRPFGASNYSSEDRLPLAYARGYVPVAAPRLRTGEPLHRAERPLIRVSGELLPRDGINELIKNPPVFDGGAQKVSFTAKMVFFEYANGRGMLRVNVGENAIQLGECVKCVSRDSPQGAGSNAAAPMDFAEPVADFRAGAVDVAAEHQADSAYQTIFDANGEIQRRRLPRNPSQPFIGIGPCVRLGKAVAQVRRDLRIVCMTNHISLIAIAARTKRTKRELNTHSVAAIETSIN